MSEYTKLHTGRVVFTGLLDLFEHVESLGCQITLDAEGEVQIANEHLLGLEQIYDLQSSCRSVAYWLAAKERA
jgi:hypothetical protein